MEIGLLIEFGKPIPGREHAAFAAYEEGLKYFREKLEKGELTLFEPFMYSLAGSETGRGFFLLKGPMEQIFMLLDDEKVRELQTRAHVAAEYVHMSTLFAAEGVQEAFDRYQKALAAL